MWASCCRKDDRNRDNISSVIVEARTPPKSIPFIGPFFAVEVCLPESFISMSMSISMSILSKSRSWRSPLQFGMVEYNILLVIRSESLANVKSKPHFSSTTASSISCSRCAHSHRRNKCLLLSFANSTLVGCCTINP